MLYPDLETFNEQEIGVCKALLWEAETGIFANLTIGNEIAYSDVYQVKIEVLVDRNGGAQ